MSLSAEEQQRLLTELSGKIQSLENEINDYKAGLTPQQILANKDLFAYLNTLNSRIDRYEAEARELRNKASAPYQAQGK
jgi:hypothetical protein